VTARRFEYAVTERLGEPPHAEPDWTPEHLLLAGLARCTLKSIDFHTERTGIAARGSAAAAGVVTRREEDGRYAFVELECGLDVELEPRPDGETLAELLDLAERDCFVGASLSPYPRYEWRVNGEVVR
jgi:organic hydroperoxide reductase OsmC/OhrA